MLYPKILAFRVSEVLESIRTVLGVLWEWQHLFWSIDRIEDQYISVKIPFTLLSDKKSRKYDFTKYFQLWP